jgi:hypothetical protein
MIRSTFVPAVQLGSLPRRATLQALAAAGLALAALPGAELRNTAARKKGKKRKKRCKRKQGGPVTCADVCPAEGSFAFHLIGGGDVCATGADPTDCVECDDDGDCAAVGVPRKCAKNFTNLATGAVGDFSSLCGAYTRGICVAFEPCVLGS